MNCRLCDTVLGHRNASGYCKRHFIANLSEEQEAKRREAFCRYASENRSKLAATIAENARKARENDPDLVARIRANAQQMQRMSKLPEHMAKRDPKAAGEKCSATKLAWCPRSYRKEYRRLIVSKRFLRDDAKRIILEQVANDTRGLDPLAAAIKLAGLAA
jgi:hypothetical protein